MNVHFSSKTDLWYTPQEFFDKYNDIYKFQTDVCALPENAKCANYFTPEQDGLKQEWIGSCWMNPPYGRTIKHWVKKAYESSLKGATTVCLLPARTDTAWWHDYCIKGDIEFIRGRLKFGGCANSAPFPSAVVVFTPKQAVRAGFAEVGTKLYATPVDAKAIRAEALEEAAEYVDRNLYTAGEYAEKLRERAAAIRGLK